MNPVSICLAASRRLVCDTRPYYEEVSAFDLANFEPEIYQQRKSGIQIRNFNLQRKVTITEDLLIFLIWNFRL